MTQLVVETPVGQAHVELDVKTKASKLLVIGHGAGGTIDSPDLLAVRNACLERQISVARVTQPYRVLGRKAPPTAATLDQAWAAVVAALGHRSALAKLNFVYAGRSSGARVACRAAADLLIVPRPVAVVALAFPLHPPGKPEKSRLSELVAVGAEVLVVQGANDPFGMPEPGDGRAVVVVPGDHSLKRSAAAVGDLVAQWIAELH